jgi:polyhydroxybutyrate depolymerase
MGRVVERVRRWKPTGLFVALALVAVGLTCVTASPGSAAEPDPEPPCPLLPKANPLPGGQKLFVNGREYWLHVPPGVTSQATLVLSLHGLGAFGYQEICSGWSAYADQAHNFIVAYPRATIGTWRIDQQESDDTRWLRAVVADIASHYSISYGGTMAQRLACEASDTFAAVVGHDAADPSVDRFYQKWLPGSPCTLTRPLTTPPDAVNRSAPRPVPVRVSCGDVDLTQASCQGADGAVNNWKARLHCSGTSGVVTLSDGSTELLNPCDSGTTVTHRIWAGVSHQYPTDPAKLARYRAEALLYFMAHPRI